ncbi:class I SAM-dependent methyltransferase [Aliifodinibius salicampi]|uniref:Class I SAM-dependent methyltransferase n=1 Tax=Fodinibius salicampi TaxID=1920655 RepID=A0ABT3PV76_9BACT|nr:class I SAM-dependent methyltransferase [Fodinibius salicampi]MCW9711762.1 class I SAM-dependent methyltransferase [Fodinibius salicampi]
MTQGYSKHLVQFFKKNSAGWLLLITGLVSLVFLIVGYLTFTITETELNGYVFSALFAGMALFVSAIFLALEYKVETRIRDAEIELKATVGLANYTNINLPLNWGDYAITAHFLDRLVKEIHRNKPALILECGSGTSTMVAASCLKEMGQGKVVSLDHLDQYARKTRDFLRLEGLEKHAEVVTAPLTEYELDSGMFQWYGNGYEGHIDRSIDMLVVDGPPGRLQSLSRYPTVPLLRNSLADEVVIMLDDGNRSDEKKIAKKWADELDATLEYDDGYKGYWVVRKNS